MTITPPNFRDTSGAFASSGRTVTVSFLLTQDEFVEACKLLPDRDVIANSFWQTVFMVGLFVYVVCFCRTGELWPEERFDALVKFLLVLGIYACIVGVLGRPVIAALNWRFNRLDLEARITVSGEGVTIDHGTKHIERAWDKFASLYESPSMYVLKTHSTEFWSVPRRAFLSGDEKRFQQIVSEKLPQS